MVAIEELRRSSPPEWWNHHGMKMYLRKLSIQPPKIVIGASTAELQITELRRGRNDEEYRWLLDWNIVHFKPTSEGVRGRVLFDLLAMEEAFGLSDRLGDFGESL